MRWTKEVSDAVTINAGHDAGPAAVSASTRSEPTAETPDARSGRLDALVPLLFMASGAAGLIYQVVWTQDLVLVFGDTTQAIVTTVSAFLAGLGIGALLGAALGARLRRALAVYGFLEIAVGCLALLMPLAFNVVATVFRNSYLTLPSGEVALIRFALAFAALTPVTLIMGMSLPVLTRHLVRTDPDVGERIARLYGLNTLGAVVGSVASGYALIELLGLRGTTYVAVALNLVAGAGAVLISRGHPKSEKVPAAPRRERGTPRLTGRQLVLLGVTFASGLVSLALEVLWTRVMLQGTGSSIYVFVAVVAVFLIGVAGGSLVYERLKDRAAQPATLGLCLAVAAGLAVLPLLVSDDMGPRGLPRAVLLILPVTLIFGYTFPLTVRLFVQSAARASRGVGFVYAANTAGCVVGTVVAGFVLIPQLGTSVAIVTVCLVLAAIGVALVIGSARRAELIKPIAGIAVIAVLLLMLILPDARHTFIQQQIALGKAQTAHHEDSVASVDVVGGKAGARQLLLNGEGITKLTIDTKLLAYIPKVARPDASTMLGICFGMGSTYRSSIVLGLHTTAVELDPTVPSMMHWFYPDASHFLLNRLGQIIINDGRNYVRLSDKRYDLITIDAPPPIWSAGAVVLMTREFYQEASQRLAPGGLLTSFIGYGPNTKLLLRTFRASFKYVTIIHGPRNFGMYMMGSQSPISLPAAEIMKVFGTPAARSDLRGAPDFPAVATSQWPSIIASNVWLTNNQVTAYAGPGPLLTDDHPLTEYFLLAQLGKAQGSTAQPRFEKAAVQTAQVVLILLAALVAGLALTSVSWRRLRPGT